MLRVFSRGLSSRVAFLIVLEGSLIAGTVVLATWGRLGSLTWNVAQADGLPLKIGLVVVVVQLSLYYAELYDLRVLGERRDTFVRLVRALATASFALAVAYYWFPALVIGRGVFVIAALLVLCLVASWRLAFEWVTRRLGPRESLLLVGTGPAAVALATELHQRRHELGVSIVGFIDPDPARVGMRLINPGVIGTVDDIPSVVRARRVDRVVVSLADGRGTLPMNKLLEMKLDGVSFDHLASVYEEYTGKIAVENLRPSWLIFSEGFRKSRWLAATKRAMDFGLAAVGLVAMFPVMLFVGLCVRLSSPGPVLYHQRRVGQHGRVFVMHKFRSMEVNAETMSGAVWARPGDPRVTRVGRFLRRARLDELPQLWNVLRGDMSLVGPRPERPEFIADLTRLIPFYGQRHVVRPGLTGWAQVRYSYGLSAEDAMQKLQYDLYYIKNMSLPLDIFIMLASIKTVVLRKGT
jgi:sugar transferase (PEP-CTERM system associated)